MWERERKQITVLFITSLKCHDWTLPFSRQACSCRKASCQDHQPNEGLSINTVHQVSFFMTDWVQTCWQWSSLILLLWTTLPCVRNNNNDNREFIECFLRLKAFYNLQTCSVQISVYPNPNHAELSEAFLCWNSLGNASSCSRKLSLIQLKQRKILTLRIFFFNGQYVCLVQNSWSGTLWLWILMEDSLM